MSIFAPQPDSFAVEVTQSQMTILLVDLPTQLPGPRRFGRMGHPIMSNATQVAERSAEIAGMLETGRDRKAFQQHLEEVLCGEAFRGSHRSGQFLRYVINRSVNGHCDELKERLLRANRFV